LQETLRVALSRDQGVDGADPQGVQRYLGSIMNGLAANMRRGARGRRTVDYDDDSAPPSSSRGAPSPERAILEREEEAERQRVALAVRDGLEGDPVAVAVWDHAMAGVRGAAEIARRMGCPVHDVYRAQERIVHRGRRLRMRAAAEAAPSVDGASGASGASGAGAVRPSRRSP
jgi:DNA-directed RNA polymerase specialized sigma24 family protein